MIETQLYSPKTPLSIPLWDEEKKMYHLYYEDGEVELSKEMFEKMFYIKTEKTLFEEQFSAEKPKLSEVIKKYYSVEEIEAELNESVDSIKMTIKLSKMIGITKEQYIKNLAEKSKASDYIFDQITAFINVLWDKE